MIIDNCYYRIKSIFGYRLRALVFIDLGAATVLHWKKLRHDLTWRKFVLQLHRGISSILVPSLTILTQPAALIEAYAQELSHLKISTIPYHPCDYCKYWILRIWLLFRFRSLREYEYHSTFLIEWLQIWIIFCFFVRQNTNNIQTAATAALQ